MSKDKLAKHTDSPEAGAATTEAAAPKTPRRTRKRRRWPLVMAGTATALVAAVAVTAGSIFPGQDATAQVTAAAQALPVGNTLANCAGPTLLLSGSAEGADPQFSANSSATRTQLNAAVLSNPAGGLPGAQLLALAPAVTVLQTLSAGAKATAAGKTNAVVLSGKEVGKPAVLRGMPANGEAAQVSGSVVVTADDGDLAGLAAANCQVAGNDLWLAGAATTVGRSAVLSLSNSSESPATVSLDLYGADGHIQTPGGKGLVVAPHSMRSIVLAGLAPEQERLTVHVKSTGGAVSALIQQSVLRGLTPGGVDYIAPTQAPAQEQTIPGVQVQDGAAKITAQSGYDDAATALEVSVPGSADAVVSVKVYGSSGQVALPNGGVFTAKAGAVSELPLSGLPAGTYSLVVSADEAFTSTARMIGFTKPGDAVDIAFAPAAARLGVNHLATLPQGMDSQLAFTAPGGGATVNLTPVSAKGVVGESKDLELKAGTTTVVTPGSLLGKDVAAVIVSTNGSTVYGTQLLGQKDSAGIGILPMTASSAGNSAINIITGN